jgi:maltodextrin utilization protein YvdJ
VFTIPAPKRAHIIKKLATILPWKTADELNEHIDWYAFFLATVLFSVVFFVCFMLLFGVVVYVLFASLFYF